MMDESSNIATIVDANPVVVLTDAKTYAEFFSHIKAEIAASEPDVSTETGRKKIKSLAYKITRSKTAIDEAGKNRTEEARKLINEVNAQRKKVREELEELAAEARQPVTNWEKAEADRIERVAQLFDFVAQLKAVPHGATSEQIKESLKAFHGLNPDEETFKERKAEADNAVSVARDVLNTALEATEKAEANERELAALRAEQEARAMAERKAAEKAEQDRLAKEAAALAEAEAKRREAEAEERARNEEKRKAAEAIAKAEREKQAAIEKAEAEKAELIRKQERQEAERKAAADREAAEKAKREANKKHRAKLTKEAVEAIRGLGIDQETSSLIVDAIIDGKIPHIGMAF